MTTALLEAPVPLMATQKTSPADQPEEPATSSTRIATDLLRMAKIVCAHTNGRGGRPLKITDYLDSILRPVIARDHQAVLDKIRAGDDASRSSTDEEADS